MSVYNIGKAGVNVDANPVQLQDGELTEAQNWTTDPAGSEGGLRKRPGLTAINASAGGGGTSVLGAINLAYTFTLTNTFYVGIRAGAQNGATPTQTWRTSTNGTTWGSVTTPTRPFYGDLRSLTTWSDEKVMISFKNRIFYAGDDYINYPTAGHSAPTIHMWDGTNDVIVGYMPYNIAAGATTNSFGVQAMAPLDNDHFLIAVDDGASVTVTGNGRVMKFNPTTGQFTQIGPTAAVGAVEFNGMIPTCLAVYGNQVWLGTENYGTGAAKIFRIHPDQDTTWTTDTTFGATFNVHSLAVYKGELYAGMRTLLGGNPSIYKRDTVGAWTASLATGTSSSGFSVFSSLVVFGENLYALCHDDGVVDVSERVTIRKFDGTTWTTVWTIETDVGESATQTRVGNGIVGPDGALYFVVAEYDAAGATAATSDGIVMRSTNGTTWVLVDTFTNMRGAIGFTRT